VVYVFALLIFIALSAACWYVSVALYKSTLDAPDPAAAPDNEDTPAIAVGAATLTCLIPFPLGYLAGLVVWGVAAFRGLGLSAGRAAVLFGYLAASSFVARLVVLGVMELCGG
jgi:hypothetical protein